MLLLLAGMVLFSPAVQKRLLDRVLVTLNEGISGKLEYEKVKLIPFNTLVLDNVSVTDSDPYTADIYSRGWSKVDTLAQAERITAVFTLGSLLSGNGAVISRATIDNGELNMVIEPGERYKDNLSRIFRLKKKQSLPEEAPDLFKIKRVRLNNFHYTMRSFLDHKPHEGIGIDWDDLDLYTDIEIHNLKMSDLIMSGVVDRMNIREKSGCVIDNISGRAEVGRGKTIVTDLVITDRWSDIHLPVFSMKYSSSKVFKDFCEEVELGGEFAQSKLSFRTLAYFTGVMPDNGICLDIHSGSICGTVSGFSFSNLAFEDPVNRISGSFNGHIRGIPDMRSAVFGIEGDHFSFTTSGLERFISEFAGNDVLTGMNKYAKGTRFTTRLRAEGSLDKLRASVTAFSSVGVLSASATASGLSGGEVPEISGSVRTSHLDLGHISGIKALGKSNLNLSGSARLFKNNTHVTLDSLNVRSIELLGYEYHDLFAKGGFDNKAPYGVVIINDPNLKCLISGKDMVYSADVARADLKAMNIDSRGTSSDISFLLEAKLHRSGSDFSSKIDIADITLCNDDGKYRPGGMHISASRTSQGDELRVRSNFADADVVSDGNILEILKDIERATSGRELPALRKDAGEAGGSSDYRIRLNLYDTRELLSFLMPDLYISNNTAFDLEMQSGDLKAELSSQRLAYADKYVKDISVAADNLNGKLTARIDSKEIKLGALSLGAPSLVATVDDNDFTLGLTLGGIGSSPGDSEISLSGELKRIGGDTLSVIARPDSSVIRIGGQTWNLSPSTLEYRGGIILADNFNISNGAQAVNLNGGINPDGRDRFRLDIDNLDLHLLEAVLGKQTNISGTINGKAVLDSPVREKLELMTSISADSLMIGGIKAGSFKAGSYWDDSEKRLNLLIQNHFSGRRAIDARLTFSPEKKDLSGAVNLDGMNLSMLEPFTSRIFSRIDGSASGKFLVHGPLSDLAVKGEGTRLDTVGIKVAFTQTEYIIDGPLDVEGNSISTDSLTVKDLYGGNGLMTGVLKNLFSNPGLSAGLSFRNLRVLDVEEAAADGFYGNLSSSGSIEVSGPLDSLHIDASIATSGPGNVHIQTSSSANQDKGNLLTFYQPPVQQDPYEEILMSRKERAKVSKSSLTARARVYASPEVTAYMDIDKSAGHMMSVRGTANADIDFNLAENRFKLNGDYDIQGGNYHFAIPGIVGKDLAISEGSSITFGGDLLDSQVDIKALYTTRTSLTALTADTSAVATRRTVNCGLNITDRLRNPSVGFSIDIPDLDPVTKTRVQSALNTEDKVQKQFISLLLFGSFIPSESSGIVNNNSNMLYANVAEIMSTQVNNILQKLEIPLDLGFGYQQNDGGTNIFDLAVSTQLFNNRVIVGGTVGNRQYSTSTSANGEVVGDLDIEIKMNRTGQVRLKLFSHSADEYTSYLDFSQRNGAGVSYQKEFNKLSDLFRKEAPAGEIGRRKTIYVENEQR